MANSNTDWFKATDSDGNDITSELVEFAEMHGLERAASGRYSLLLLFELYHWGHAGRLNPGKVIEEIEFLEGLRQFIRSKPASVFDRNKPLRGLWHKHYLEDGLPSMAKNLRKGLMRYGIPCADRMVQDTEESGEERYFSRQDVMQIAHDAVEGNWKRLMDESALTGQWIIFARNESKNYYLCLGRHDSGDEKIREQIDKVCVREFPFLEQLLS